MIRGVALRLAAPSAVYHQHTAKGVLRPDPRQVDALHQVDRIYHDLVQLTNAGIPRRDTNLTPPPREEVAVPTSRAAAADSSAKKGGFFSSFMTSAAPAAGAPVGASSIREPARTTLPAAPLTITHPLSLTKGLYLHGDVGCGKTHLMDMLYSEIPLSLSKKRVHFHQFMQQVHKDMHRIKTVHGRAMDGNQLMLELAKQQCAAAEVLCFDELVVADVADAMILRRLFENMYHVGVCCFFTSNRAPRALYDGGLNRGSFIPFIDLLQERCAIHDMTSGTDHRLIGTMTETYLYPIDAETESKFEQQYTDRIKGQIVQPRALRVYGRDFVVDRAAGGVCRFNFQELCQRDTSVADFSELAREFHTVFLSNVPQFKAGNSDVKRRFITLLDELYQYKVKVFVLAQVGPDELEPGIADASAALAQAANEESFYAGKLINSGEDQFQMRRCISRLQEMRTLEYAKQAHLGHAR